MGIQSAESSGSSRNSRFSGCESHISEAQALHRNLVAIDRAPSGTEEIYLWWQRIECSASSGSENRYFST